MRGTVIDLGSNTFHALVADVDELGLRNAVLERKLPVRLGEHAFEAERIPAEACARATIAWSRPACSARP
jgi:exopolyphosphatase/guanosine-5'-triphosphate,3'-diphosphate pyrophosphatase